MSNKNRISTLRTELPQLKVPLSMLVDDSSPGEEIYTQFIEAFAELVDNSHIGGKITVMPYCFPESLDEALRGDRPLKLRKLVDIIRDRIAPYFDITPEILTHNPVVDLSTGGFIYPCVAEHIWSQKQNEETLTLYITRALQILKKAGLEANGVTSPTNFGKDVETAYVRAILKAEKEINSLSLTWYFLHVERGKQYLEPRLAHLDIENREAVVSIVSGKGDFQTELANGLTEEEKISTLADEYLTTDGHGGWLAGLIRTRSWIVFHHHWWHRFRENRLGLKAYAEVFRRVDCVYGDKLLWMKPSEMARYFATMNSFRVDPLSVTDGILLKLRSPFQCPAFTISLEILKAVTSLTVDGKMLKEADGAQTLERGSWTVKDNRLFICFDLDLATRVKIHTGPT